MKEWNRIKCAAMQLPNGDIISGYRHDDCIRNIMLFNKNRDDEDAIAPSSCVQGFIDHNNLFLTREEAAIRAFEYKQIKNKKDRLFSEDLY